MTDYVDLLEKELTEVLVKNLSKFRLPVVVELAKTTIEKYFDNLRYR